MESFKRELLVARIISGRLRFKFDNKIYLIGPPSPMARYEAQEIYEEVYIDCKFEGVLTSEQMLDFLYYKDLWSDEKQKRLKLIEQDMEEFKLRMFELDGDTNAVEGIRKVLDIARKDHEELLMERYQNEYMTAEGIAGSARLKYLIGAGIRNHNDTFLYPNGGYTANSVIIDKAISFYFQNKLGEAEYRDLARNDPWRSIWSSRKNCNGVFSCPSIDLTDEQRAIILWSQIFESIQESPEAPSDHVFDDDDLLDGWMIKQRRKRDLERGQNKVEEVINSSSDRIKNAQEVYIVSQPNLTPKEIGSLNDESTKRLKKRRLEQIEKAGTISEFHLDDTRQKIQMEMNNLGVPIK